VRPKTGSTPCRALKTPKRAEETGEFRKFAREIPQFENQQLTTPIGCELFRPSLVLAIHFAVIPNFKIKPFIINNLRKNNFKKF
jgi:hypothetical protein